MILALVYRKVITSMEFIWVLVGIVIGLGIAIYVVIKVAEDIMKR